MSKQMKKHIIMLIIGLIFTLLYVITYWTGEILDVIINVCSMIGSGVLCSAIVGIVIEFDNKRKQEIKNKYIFDDFNFKVKNLLRLEIVCLSNYLSLSYNKKVEYQKVNMSFKEIIEYLLGLLSKITSSTATLYLIQNGIDCDLIKREEKGNYYAYKNTLPYYKEIQATVSYLLSDTSIYYINDLLTKEKIETLKEFQFDLSNIVLYSNEDNLELLFEHKKIFYNNFIRYLTVIGFGLEESLEIKYKNVISIEEK